jgi:hypothetical protein
MREIIAFQQQRLMLAMVNFGYNPRMFRTLFFNLPMLLLIVASAPSALPGDQDGLSKTGVFTDVSMGLSFKPPSGLKDMTAALKKPHKTTGDVFSEFDFLLRMSSVEDANAPDWASVMVATYPRGRDRDNTDDTIASFFTNHALVSGTIVDRGVIKYSGYQFAVSIVKNTQERPTIYATAYTTVQRDNFLSFVFAGKDPQTVDKLTKSMITVKLIP